jgi:hypothetical protein
VFLTLYKQAKDGLFGRTQNALHDVLDGSHGTLGALACQFDRQKEVLLSVSADTEQEFIAFGREAGALFADSTEILKLVGGVLEKVAGENAQKAVELFEALIDDAGKLMAADEAEILGLIEEMSELKQEMNRLLNYRATMERAVRLPLLLLRVGFRIEGSHTQGRLAKALESVALEVTTLRDKLTSAAERQFVGLEEAARAMAALVATLSKMSEDAHRQHGEGSERMQELRRHAAQLREAGLSQGELARSIGENGRSLHKEFNRVVVALQYHDITRQQLDHVGEAFDTMRGWLPSVSPGENAKTHQEPAMLHHASVLQIQQTRSTLGSLKSAGREFRESVEAIAQRAEALTTDISVFSGLCHNESVLRALEGLAALQAIIEARSAIKREVGESACEIYGKVTDCTQQVRELTLDLRLLAINAQVQAANAGQQRVVEVLAENMGQVSDSIQEATQSLASEMEIIMKQISALGTRAWKLGTQQTDEGKAMAKAVPRCANALRELQTSVTVGLDSACHSQLELRQRIQQLLLGVQFPELASRRLETVLAFFEELERATIPAGGSSNASREALQDFSSSYTMAREREVHAAVIRHEAASDGESPVDSPDRAFDAESLAGGLGDNVELF